MRVKFCLPLGLRHFLETHQWGHWRNMRLILTCMIDVSFLLIIRRKIVIPSTVISRSPNKLTRTMLIRGSFLRQLTRPFHQVLSNNLMWKMGRHIIIIPIHRIWPLLFSAGINDIFIAATITCFGIVCTLMNHVHYSTCVSTYTAI